DILLFHHSSFHPPTTTEISTLSLHDALPILELGGKSPAIIGPHADFERAVERILVGKLLNAGQTCIAPDYVLVQADQRDRFAERSEEHTSELQSRRDLVCRLLLEKKKKKKYE